MQLEQVAKDIYFDDAVSGIILIHNEAVKKSCLNKDTIYVEILTVILIWRFGDHVKIAKLTYSIINQ